MEFYGFNDQFNFDTGMAFLIKDNLQLDTYFGTGINNKMYFVPLTNLNLVTNTEEA